MNTYLVVKEIKKHWLGGSPVFIVITMYLCKNGWGFLGSSHKWNC